MDLVEELAAEGDGGDEAEGVAPEDDVELLWHGAQGNVFTAITLALDDAGIRYNREKLDARLAFGGSAPLNIWVPAVEIEAARKVLAETLTLISQPVATANVADFGDEGGWADAPTIVQDPHPEDAVSEVWSGEEEGMAEFLKSCLAANGIGCCILEREQGPFAVGVLPEDQERAAAIVRQVIEGTAPA
ncbi:MAG: hypothetical protein KGL59_07485 [Acidobacteriota bacterium]|nr:hypothetical protein [Acidobacteriota bacterium]